MLNLIFFSFKSEASCDQKKLMFLIKCIDDDIKMLMSMEAELISAESRMEMLVDCHPSGYDHNKRLWDVYDKVLELIAYRPHAVADLGMKKQLVMHEKDRCMKRSK